MSSLYYLAYGSNLHPFRLQQRIPSSRPLGKITLRGYQLAFHKKGQDKSGKCNIIQTGQQAHHVNAAIFEMHVSEKALLDSFEGKGYFSQEMPVTLEQRNITAFAYIAAPGFIDNALQPYHWYKHMVIHGAQYQGFPADYIAEIERVRSSEDPDALRRAKNHKLIKEIQWSANTYR